LEAHNWTLPMPENWLPSVFSSLNHFKQVPDPISE